MEKYDYIFRWLKNASKAERHIDEMEDFAKKHPIIFMKLINILEISLKEMRMMKNILRLKMN